MAFDKFADLWHSGFSKDLPSLLDYSQHCLAHAVGPPESVLRNMIVEFLTQAADGTRLERLGWRSPPWNDYGFRLQTPDWPSKPSVLWIAAATNLLETAKFLLESKAVHVKHSDSAEISVASYYGHLQMVQLLMSCARANRYMRWLGIDYGSALQAASCGGHINVVQWLIEQGASVHATGGRYGGALQGASFGGHINIIQLLIEQGVNINVNVDPQAGEYSNALQAASHEGHIDVVKLLID
jgi:ankyrin repeat protein